MKKVHRDTKKVFSVDGVCIWKGKEENGGFLLDCPYFFISSTFFGPKKYGDEAAAGRLKA